MRRLIGTDLYRCSHILEYVGMFCMDGLFDKFDTDRLACSHHCSDVMFIPRLIYVNDEARFWRGLPNPFQPHLIPSRTKLDLQERVLLRSSTRLFGHLSRGVETYCKRGLFGQRPNIQKFPNSFPLLFAFEIPQRAIKCVARRACRQKALQLLPCYSFLNRSSNRLYLRLDTFDSLTVTTIRDTFSSSLEFSHCQCCNNDFRFRFRSPRNRKRTANGPRFHHCPELHNTCSIPLLAMFRPNAIKGRMNPNRIN